MEEYFIININTYHKFKQSININKVDIKKILVSDKALYS